MTVVQFDVCIAGEPDGAYDWNTLAEHAERTQLHAMRKLHAQIRERTRLTTKLDATPDISDGEQAGDRTKDHLKDADRRIAQLMSYLASAGWDLEGWVNSLHHPHVGGCEESKSRITIIEESEVRSWERFRRMRQPLASDTVCGTASLIVRKPTSEASERNLRLSVFSRLRRYRSRVVSSSTSRPAASQLGGWATIG